MAINEGLPFASSITYKGESPLDTRMLFNTLSDMASYPDYQIGDGALTFNKETNKTYIYGKSNEIDPTLGKWREFRDEKMIETTYANLKAKKDAGELIPGQSYRITDYVTKVANMDFTIQVGGSGTWKVAKSMEQPFDLIVTAITNNILSEDAKATNHPGATKQFRAPDKWIVKYTIDNDTSKYNWADATNGKGVIWYLEDDLGNSAYFDFKNVVYQRALVTDCPFNTTMNSFYVGIPALSGIESGTYNTLVFPVNPMSNATADQATLDLTQTVWLYTYNGYGAKLSQTTLDATEDPETKFCCDNKMLGPTNSNTSPCKIILPNIVFSGAPKSFHTAYRALNITLMHTNSSGMYGVDFNGANYNITVVNNVYAIDFDYEATNITAGYAQYSKFLNYSHHLNITSGGSNEYHYCAYLNVGKMNGSTTIPFSHKQFYETRGTTSAFLSFPLDTTNDTSPAIYLESKRLPISIIDTTYADLKAKVDTGMLTPGQQYRITDYVTKLNSMTYAMSAGGTWKVAKSMEHPFDLIVTAITPNKLNENAKAANHVGATKQFRNPDGWTIKYDINNDTTKYNWADTTNGKGVIWYMEDDYGNVAYYDFKNVVYQRAKVLTCPFNPRMVGYYVGMPQLTSTTPAHGYQTYTMPYNPNTAYGNATLDLNDTVWLYTWNGLNTTVGSQDTIDTTEDITTLCGGNKMFTPAQQYQTATAHDKIILPNTVFSGSPRMTYMGYRCLNNTLMQVKMSQSSSPGTMYSIRLRGLNYAVTILNNAYALEIDDECYYITAYSSVYAKFMKYSYGINIIGGSYNEYYRCRYVTIGQIGTTNSYGHKICYDLYGSQTNNVTLYKDGASDNNPEIINGTSSQTTTSEHYKFLTTKDYLKYVFENTTRETIYNAVGGTNHEVGYSAAGGCKWSSSTESPDGATGAYYTFQLIMGGAGEGATIICSRTSTGKSYVSYRQGSNGWTAWSEIGRAIEEFSPSEAFSDGTALKISTVESNAKAIVIEGKWLILDSYFASSVSQANSGWVNAININSNFKYKIDTTRQSRTLGSMWAGGAYQNTAFSRLSGGGIGMYYYGPLLNQTGGVNAMLRIPVVLK